ncbi:hypothetical protein HDE_13062 [Halotydeus destructor]|nr:hypothetical protein HDE_13062 [Halotydeus destructor]
MAPQGSAIFPGISDMIAMQLSEVRNLVRQRCEVYDFENGDLDMVHQDDQYVTMFLDDNGGDVDKTADAILRALVYRKKYDIAKLDVRLLPMDMFCWNSKIGRDIYGKKVRWIAYGCHRKIPELLDSTLKTNCWYAMNCLRSYEKCDLYADLRGVSFRSIDMRFTRKVSSMAATCFPGIVDHVYVCGLPLTLTAVVQAMVNVLPSRHASKISFISIDQARARICKLDHVPAPQGSNIRDVLIRDNVHKDRIEEIVRTFNCAKSAALKLFDELKL